MMEENKEYDSEEELLKGATNAYQNNTSFENNLGLGTTGEKTIGDDKTGDDKTGDDKTGDVTPNSQYNKYMIRFDVNPAGDLKLESINKFPGEPMDDNIDTNIEVPQNPTQDDLRRLVLLGKIPGFFYGHNDGVFTDITRYLNELLNRFNSKIDIAANETRIYSNKEDKYTPFYNELTAINDFVDKITNVLNKVITSAGIMPESNRVFPSKKIEVLTTERGKLTNLHNYITYNAESINIFMKEIKTVTDEFSNLSNNLNTITDYKIVLPEKITKYVNGLPKKNNVANIVTQSEGSNNNGIPVVSSQMVGTSVPTKTTGKENEGIHFNEVERQTVGTSVPTIKTGKSKMSVIERTKEALGTVKTAVTGFFGTNKGTPLSNADDSRMDEPQKQAFNDYKIKIDNILQTTRPEGGYTDVVKKNINVFKNNMETANNAGTLDKLVQEKLVTYIHSIMDGSSSSNPTSLIAVDVVEQPDVTTTIGGKKSRRRRGGMKKVKQNKTKRIHAIVTRRRKQMKKAGTKRR
jgi:hypothetical protein